MIRFLAGITQLDGIANASDLAARLPTMRDYIQTRDRDAGHLLNAIDMYKPRDVVKGLDAAKLIRRLERVIRAINQGRGGEFSRSAFDVTDEGLDGDRVKIVAQQLIGVARKAIAIREPVVPIRFSSRLVR